MRKRCARSSVLLINNIARARRQRKYALGKIYLQPAAHLPNLRRRRYWLRRLLRGRRTHARSTTTTATSVAIETIVLGIHAAAAPVRGGATGSWSMRLNTLRVICCAAADVLSVCHFGALYPSRPQFHCIE